MIGFSFTQNNIEYVIVLPSITYVSGNKVVVGSQELEIYDSTVMASLETAIAAYQPGGGGGGDYSQGYADGEAAMESTIASSQAITANLYKSKLASEDATIAAADSTDIDGQGTIFSESYSYLKTSAEMQANYNSGYSAGETAGYSAGETAGYTSGYSAGEAAGETTGYANGQNAAASAQETVAGQYKSKLSSEDADIAAADATTLAGQGTIFSESYQYLKTAAEMQSNYDSGYSAGETAGETAGYTNGYNDGYADAMWKGLVIEAVDDIFIKLNYNLITTFQYSKDRGAHWYPLHTSYVDLDEGQKMWLRGSGFSLAMHTSQPVLNVTGRYKISGALTSLLDQTGESDNIQPDPTVNCDYQFQEFFQNDTNLVSAENLVFPSKIADNTYTASATESVFYRMFYGCTNMVKGPKSLPATKLGNYAYDGMFHGCSNMTECMDELPMTTGWIMGVYREMFRECSSLVKAPKIKWTGALDDNDEFPRMFYGCSALNEIEVNVSNWDTSSCTNWVYGVSATGTFIKPSGTTIPTGVNGIPSGWTVVNV